MNFRWIHSGFAMDLQCVSHEFTMNLQWIHSGFAMDLQCVSHEFTMCSCGCCPLVSRMFHTSFMLWQVGR